MAADFGPEWAKQPKGILKKAPPSSAAAAPAGAAGRVRETEAEREREAALRRAAITQQRKELEAAVLDSLVVLSEYPLVQGPDYSAARPAASDAAGFRSHIRLFQPGDYDDLVVERNINGRCGYSLCPVPNQKLGNGVKWKLVNKGREDFAILPREEIEKWCSSDCRRRALWVRLQLTETAAWERAGAADIQISLYGETKEDTAAAQPLARRKLDHQRKTEAATSALALERGDADDATQQRGVEVMIREHNATFREPAQQEEEGEAGAEDDAHLLLEGYRVKMNVYTGGR